MRSKLESEIRSFAREYETTLPPVDVDDLRHSDDHSAPALGRRRRLLAIAVVIAAVLVVSLALQRNDVALAIVEFPDGSEVRIDPLFALDDADALADLEAQLSQHGVELVIDEIPVNTQADGRIYGIEFGAPLRPDSSGRINIPADAAGAVIRVTVGRGDPSAGIEGLLLFEVYPELCRAIDPFDTLATETALGRLGVAVKWHWLVGEPDGQGGGLVQTKPIVPPDGKIISVLTADWSNLAPAEFPTIVMIEVIPLEASWHHPVDPERCPQS